MDLRLETIYNIFFTSSRGNFEYPVQGSAHGIHFRQKYIPYRNRCLQLGKVEYDQIEDIIHANWHPFRLR